MSLPERLVLQSMEQKNKQDFEMHLMQVRNTYENLRQGKKEAET